MAEEEYEKQNKRIEKALFRAATGYKIKLKSTVKVKEETNKPGAGKEAVERVVPVVEEKYVEPKITAAMFWLKSRMPEKWGGGERTANAAEDMTPVIEAYASLIDNPMPGRELEEGEDEQNPLCSAD